MVNRKGAVSVGSSVHALTGFAGNVSIRLENRGELRRLAATKNNRLNSSASFQTVVIKFDESPALFASAGLFHELSEARSSGRAALASLGSAS